MSVYFSVPTLDEKAWRETEPHTPSPRARLEGVRKMNEAGVPSGILVAPLIPGVNDAPEQVGEIMRIAAESGAISMAPRAAPPARRASKDIWFDWLRAYRPDLDAALRGAVQARRLRARARSASGSQQMVDERAPAAAARGARAGRPARGRRRREVDPAGARSRPQRQESLF